MQSYDLTNAVLRMQNLDAERSVLGAMIQDPDVLSVTAEIQKDDFYHSQHQEIYDAMRAAQKECGKVDLITVDEELRRRGTLEAIGGVQYLVSLTSYVPTTANTPAYVDILMDYSKRRKFLQMTQDVQSRLVIGQDAIGEIALDVMDYMRDLKPYRRTYVSMWDLIYRTVDTINERAKGFEKPIPFGFDHIKKEFYGFSKGDLIVIGARPSVGKSALGMHIANNAVKSGHVVGFISLEMTELQYGIRELSVFSNVEMQKIQEGAMSENEYDRYAEIIGPTACMDIYFEEHISTIEKIISTAYTMVTQSKVDILIVDYLQLIGSTKNHKDLYTLVSYVSRTLKQLAKELQIPIVALAQLSRAAKERRDKRPIMSDLRESGQIEQDADTIIMMHREDDENAEWLNDDKRDALRRLNARGAQMIMLRFEKQRQGPVFSTYVAFYPETMQFRSIEWFK